jgi:hypothetical protein
MREISDRERESLDFLSESVERTKKKYSESLLPDDLAAWEAATAAYDKKSASLEKKYADAVDHEDAPSAAWADFEPTKNRSAVQRFLVGLGYDIPPRTFQRHAKKGDIKTSEDGFFTKKLTRDYIRTQGLVSKFENISEPSVEIVLDKAVHDAKRAKYAALREEEKWKREKKMVGSREEFNLELAGRLVVMDNVLRGFADKYASELVVLVGGQIDKRDDFVSFWIKKFDEEMKKLSRPINYEVIFRRGDAGE